MKKKLSLFMIFITIILLINTPAYAHQFKKSVIIFSSYHHGYEWNDTMEDGILSVLKDQNSNIKMEYLDSLNVNISDYYDKLFEMYKSKYKNNNVYNVNLNVIDNLPLEDIVNIVNIVNENPKQNIILYASTLLSTKQSHKLYPVEAITKLKNKTTVPIYGVWDILLDKGIIGGKITSSYTQGVKAGNLALKILNGEKYDKLTNIYNRGSFEKVFDKVLNDALKFSTPFFLVLFDLNDLKVINDHYGHLEGDKYISSFTDNLKATISDWSILARYGGDEFVGVFFDTAPLKLSENFEKLNEPFVNNPIIHK